MATAFFLLVAQVVSVAYLPADEVEMIIKLFISSFCVLIILNELERWKMLSDSPFFSNWVPRGVSELLSDNFLSF